MSPLAAIVAAGICAGTAARSFQLASAYKDRQDKRAITCYLRTSCCVGAALAFLIAWAWAVIA